MNDFKDSKAKQAVEEALQLVLQTVESKHPIRGDSWMGMELATMIDLSEKKAGRVKFMYNIVDTENEEKIAAECEDELKDLIAYSAFQLFLIRRKKNEEAGSM